MLGNQIDGDGRNGFGVVIDQASDNKIGTLVDQVLLYCYHYDPATGKYSAIITRIVRLSAIATILTLGVMFVALSRRRTTT